MMYDKLWNVKKDIPRGSGISGRFTAAPKGRSKTSRLAARKLAYLKVANSSRLAETAMPSATPRADPLHPSITTAAKVLRAMEASSTSTNHGSPHP